MAAVETQKKSVRAQAKYVHSSARKARLVTDLIAGAPCEAQTILAFSKRAVAKDVERLRRRANGVAPDLHWNGDDLVILVAYVDEGPTLKRFRPCAAVPRHPQADVPYHGRSRAARASTTGRPKPAAEEKPRKQRAPKAAAVEATEEETPVATEATATVEEPTTAPAPAEEKPKAARRKKKTEESDS
jgi:large subunit ribosomal protein L22